MELTHGSLFSGIGGFDLGAERAGFRNVYNSEINPFCNRYLKKAHPGAKQYGSIGNIPKKIEKTTVVSAGFPCQDISACGKGAGIFGAQSALFFEALRIVDDARPDFVLMENSPLILTRGMHFILASLAQIGYMCEWECLRACDFGYPHKRERLYLIAYPISKRLRHMVFRPIETIDLYAKWTPTTAYLRVLDGGIKPKGVPDHVSPSDGVPGWGQYIHAIGNAVMPVVAEYLFKCVRRSIEEV